MDITQAERWLSPVLGYSADEHPGDRFTRNRSGLAPTP